MKVRFLLLATFAIVLVGAAVTGGTFLGRSLSASPPASTLIAPQLQIAQGEFPLTFQGILLKDDGTPVANSSHSLTFSIYSDETINTSLWRETQTVFTLDGLFTVELGTEEEIDPQIFADDQETWLGIRVGFNPEMRPRIRLAYAPYAIHAITADNLTSPQPSPRQVALLRWYEANDTEIRVVVDDEPSAIAFDGENMWVANRGDEDEPDDDVVTKVSTITGKRVTDHDVGTNPVAVAFDGQNIWVSNRNSDDLTRYRTDGSNRRTLTLDGSRPGAMAFDGRYMWIVLEGSNEVVRYDMREDTFVDEDPGASGQAGVQGIPVGSNPRAIAFDGTLMWVTHSGSRNVTRIRASDGSVVDTIAAGEGRAAIAFDGNSMWIVNQGRNNVAKVRVSDGELLGTFPVGTRPVSIAFDGRAIWVVNTDSDNVTKLRASDGELLGTFPTDDSPMGIAFDGAYMWVVNQGDDNVMKK